MKLSIYLACLAAYNNGYLHGAWIEANQDVDSLKAEVKTMLASSPIPNAEEFAIYDYEGFGEGMISEYSSLEKVAELAEFIAEHGELGSEVMSHFCGDLKDARRALDESYHSEFSSEEDFAYYWIHEVDGREVSDYLANYIDYQAIARDFFISDFFSIEVARKVYVFSHH